EGRRAADQSAPDDRQIGTPWRLVGRAQLPVRRVCRHAFAGCIGRIRPCVRAMVNGAARVTGRRLKVPLRQGRAFGPTLAAMPVTSPARRPARLIALAASFAFAAVALAACSSTASAPSFDASAPCTVDAKLAGAYPALEALIPAKVGDTAHVSLASGRNCTATNLGTLADHGVKEVHFAGGVWQDSSEGAITLAV